MCERLKNMGFKPRTLEDSKKTFGYLYISCQSDVLRLAKYISEQTVFLPLERKWSKLNFILDESYVLKSKRWLTEDDFQFIAKNYKTKTNKQITAEIGVSNSNIKRVMKNLGSVAINLLERILNPIPELIIGFLDPGAL